MLARFRLFPLLLLLLLPLATGCGDDGPGDIQVPPLTQTEADDVAQLAGIATGTDQGGWLTVLEATQGGMPFAPQRFRGGLGSIRGGNPDFRFASNPGPGFGALRDSIFDRANVHYVIHYLYADTAGTDSIADWNSDVREVQFSSTGSGTIQAGADSGGFHHTAQGNGFGLFESDAADTLDFIGSSNDSLFNRFAQFSSPATIRYYNTNFFTDFDFGWNRANNPPFPWTGTATISMLAERLNSLNPTDRTDDFVDAEITITFDGTQTPLIGVTNDPNNAAPQFRYRMNLKTGVVTRFP
jgi:hypothetical protein